MEKFGAIFQVMPLLIDLIYSTVFNLNHIIGCEFSNPEKLIDKIADKFKTLFVQSGDIGSFDNINAGLDCAFWDLFAKTKKIPLNKLLNTESQKHISVYASGINPSESLSLIHI